MDANLASLISDLTSTATRELALIELSKKREMIEDLAPLLWHSFGKLFLWTLWVNKLYFP